DLGVAVRAVVIGRHRRISSPQESSEGENDMLELGIYAARAREFAVRAVPFGISLATFVLVLSGSADAGATFTVFDPSGSTGTFAYSINGKGAVTGYFEDSGGVGHGFVRAVDGTITTFDPSGSTYTQPNSINSKGVI